MLPTMRPTGNKQNQYSRDSIVNGFYTLADDAIADLGHHGERQPTDRRAGGYGRSLRRRQFRPPARDHFSHRLDHRAV